MVLKPWQELCEFHRWITIREEKGSYLKPVDWVALMPLPVLHNIQSHSKCIELIKK